MSDTPFYPPLDTPIDDLDLDIALQRIVRNILMIDGKWVRPRYQDTPPPTPPHGTDWFAIGVMREFPDANVHWKQDPTNADQRIQQRHWDVEVMLSSYGPNASQNAAALQAGLLVPQNLLHLLPLKMSFTSTSDSTFAPELLGGKWVRRVDLTLMFRRQVDTLFDNPTIAEAPDITIATEP